MGSLQLKGRACVPDCPTRFVTPAHPPESCMPRARLLRGTPPGADFLRRTPPPPAARGGAQGARGEGRGRWRQAVSPCDRLTVEIDSLSLPDCSSQPSTPFQTHSRSHRRLRRSRAHFALNRLCEEDAPLPRAAPVPSKKVGFRAASKRVGFRAEDVPRVRTRKTEEQIIAMEERLEQAHLAMLEAWGHGTVRRAAAASGAVGLVAGNLCSKGGVAPLEGLLTAPGKRLMFAEATQIRFYDEDEPPRSVEVSPEERAAFGRGLCTMQDASSLLYWMVRIMDWSACLN